MVFNKKQIQYNFNHSVKDGIFWILMSSISSVFLVPFILDLGASSFQVGLLGSFPIFIASFFTLISYRVLKLFSSKKQAVVFFITSQALMWIPLSIMHFFFSKQVTVWLIIFIYVIINTLGVTISPIYNDWIRRIFPRNKMGDYLARKNLILQMISIIPILLTGYILNLINSSETLIGFTIVFLLACVFRLLSAYNLNKMSKTENKETIIKEVNNISKRKMFKAFKNSLHKNKSFQRFLIFIVILYFSIYVGTLYLPYFLLHTLHFSYIKYVWWSVAYVVGTFLSLRYWGYISDKFGSVNVLKNTTIFLPLFLLVPAIFYKYYFVIIFINFFAGVVISGLNLSISNYFYQYVKSDFINNYSFFIIIQATAIFVGAMFGSLIIKFTRSYFKIELYAIITVLIVSSIFRLISFLFSLRLIDDKNNKQLHMFKDVIFQRPVVFGISELRHFFIYEEKKLVYDLDLEKEKMYNLMNNKNKDKKEKELYKKIKNDEKEIKKSVKEIINVEKELIDEFDSKK